MMIEEKILNAVSEVTGVPQQKIKSDDSTLDVVRARLMYYYLCDENRILSEIYSVYVGRSSSTARNGVKSFKDFMQRNEKYKKLADDALKIIRGYGETDKYAGMIKPGEDSLYIEGKKYSILDVSSRYFGNGFLGMIDGELACYSDSKDCVARELIEKSNN